MIDPSAARRLGEVLTGSEAGAVADRLDDGQTLSAALRVIPSTRRSTVRSLMTSGGADHVHLIPVLRAVEGARSDTTTHDPLWTMPGHLAGSGPLTSSVVHLVDAARESVVCSTFNFQRSSGLWSALRRAAQRPEVRLRVYVDSRATDHQQARSPTTGEIAAHLHPGCVLRTGEFDGVPVRNHAKFLAIDHRFLLVTSANFSWSAEYGNVELGLAVDDPNLTEAVEREMRRAEGSLYAPVLLGQPAARPPAQERDAHQIGGGRT